jgi:hypothetical protein
VVEFFQFFADGDEFFVQGELAVDQLAAAAGAQDAEIAAR